MMDRNRYQRRAAGYMRNSNRITNTCPINKNENDNCLCTNQPKVVKLFIALFVAIGNARFETHLEELQEANRQLKAQAKKVMQQSNDVSQTLKEKDIAKIISALHEYENRLTTLSASIDRKVNEVLTEQGERQSIR